MSAFVPEFMTFLNPFVLIGLAAAAIPIIIHLLNLRKLKTVEFSSLQFLKELQKTRMRRLRIKQLLLLAIRTLLVVALVLAFSRPTLQGSFAQSLGTHVKTTIVALLDDSPSMSVRNERGILFSQAKESAADLLNLVKPGDEVYLVKLSDVRHERTFSPLFTVEAVRAALGRLSPSQETATYQEALAAAGNILHTSMNLSQETYLIGDGQATQFEEPPPTQWDFQTRKITSDSAGLLGDRGKLFLVDVENGGRTSSYSNAGVSSVELGTQIFAQNKPVSVYARVQNYGSAELRNATLSAYLDGARVVQQSMDITSGAATVVFSVIPRRTGALPGYVQIEDDALEIDNTRYFVLNVPDNVRILLVGAAPQDTQLPLLALTLGSDTTLAKSFTVQQITENQLPSTDVSRYDVAMLCNVRDFSPVEADRLVQFVKGGGGLVIFPGKETNISNSNEALFARMAIPPMIGPVRYSESQPAGPQGGRGDSDNSRSFLSFGRVDYDHPLFAGLFEKPSPGKKSSHTIESPRVYTAFTPAIGKHGRTIIALSNGAGFLTEYPVESGRVMLFSVDAGLAWSDFPVKGLFAPLLHRIAAYATAQNQPPLSFLPGDNMKIRVRLRDLSARSTYILTTPSAVDERVVPSLLSPLAVATFESPNSSEVGIYRLHIAASERKDPGGKEHETLQTVAVNVDPRESDLRHVSEKELSGFYARIGIKPAHARRLPANEHIESRVLESRFGVELWKYFVGLAIILALAEMAIGRVSHRNQQQ